MEHKVDKSFCIIASCGVSQATAAGLKQQYRKAHDYGAGRLQSRGDKSTLYCRLIRLEGPEELKGRHRSREVEKKRTSAAGLAGVMNGSTAWSDCHRKSCIPALSVITNPTTVGTCGSIRRGIEHLTSLYAIFVGKHSNYEGWP